MSKPVEMRGGDFERMIGLNCSTLLSYIEKIIRPGKPGWTGELSESGSMTDCK